jgi:hypothetical protein
MQPNEAITCKHTTFSVRVQKAKVTTVVARRWTKTRCHLKGRWRGCALPMLRFRDVGGLALSRARSALAICAAGLRPLLLLLPLRRNHVACVKLAIRKAANSISCSFLSMSF